MTEEKKPLPHSGPQPEKPSGSESQPRALPSRPAPLGSAGSPAAGTAARPTAPPSPGRRRFLINWLALAWSAFAVATATALATVLRFMFPNVLFEPKSSFNAGRPEDYEVDKVDTRWKEQYRVWIVRTRDKIYALSAVCTHLGCTPNWLEAEQKFKCPCHGSGFYKSGINFEGPAPRPLERFRIVLTENGEILIDKSKKFLYEKGEWNNPESYIVV